MGAPAFSGAPPSSGGGGGGGGATEATLLAVLANQTNGNQTVDIIDRAGRILGHVVVDSSALPAGAATDAGLAAIFLRLGDGSQHAIIDASALPAGAATEATLATRAADATITARLNTLGQKTMALSAPVVLSSDQSAIPVTVGALPLPAGAATEATLATRAADATITARLNTLGQKTMALSAPVVLSSDQSAIPVTAAALPLPAGAATEATLATRATEATLATRAADATITARLNTLGQKTMALSAPVVLSSDQSAIPVTAAALPLPAGAATEATLATRATEATLATRATEATLATRAADATITARLNTLGQKTMALSAPVVLSSDQSAIPVTAAALPLPAGAATEATLATRATEATLATRAADATITARLNTLGQKTMALSAPVVLSSDQSAIPVTGPTLTKGTQGAQGFSVQSLTDAGRVRVSIIFQAVAPATADTLLSLVKVSDGVAAGASTSIAVTAGKRLRLTAIVLSVRAGAAAAAFATLTLRQNPVGATVLASQSEIRVDVGNTAAAIGASVQIVVPLPDGYEYSGTQTLGVSLAAQAITNIVSIALVGFEY